MYDDTEIDYQWGRAAFHFCWFFFFLWLVQIESATIATIDGFVMVVPGSSISIDLLRVGLHHHFKHTAYRMAPSNLLWQGFEDWFMDFSFIREEERSKPFATTSYLAGVAIIYWLCVHVLDAPVFIPYMACIILAAGDPAARICGLKWGKIKTINGRTLRGTLGFLLVSFAALSVTNILDVSGYPVYYEVTGNRLLVMQFTGCFTGAVTEATSPKFDNLTIPFVSGISMYIVYML